MAKVLIGVETLPKISVAWVGCTNVTDRRQTDGRTMTYSERKTERHERSALAGASNENDKHYKNIFKKPR